MKSARRVVRGLGCVEVDPGFLRLELSEFFRQVCCIVGRVVFVADSAKHCGRVVVMSILQLVQYQMSSHELQPEFLGLKGLIQDFQRFGAGVPFRIRAAECLRRHMVGNRNSVSVALAKALRTMFHGAFV